MDEMPLSSGGVLRVHSQDKCIGQPCGIHNPSRHPLRHAPIHWREDRRLLERICPHGIGHPDPDGLAFKTRNMHPGDAWAESVHGCDGCCQGSDVLDGEIVVREIEP